MWRNVVELSRTRVLKVVVGDEEEDKKDLRQLIFVRHTEIGIQSGRSRRHVCKSGLQLRGRGDGGDEIGPLYNFATKLFCSSK